VLKNQRGRLKIITTLGFFPRSSFLWRLQLAGEIE